MAKRQCDPTSGSIGNQVYLQGRNGQVVRNRTIPTYRNTGPLQIARTNLSAISQSWRALTDAVRTAWTTAAQGVNSRPRLGQYGVLTGEQLYCKINICLASTSQMPTELPPAYPEFGALAPQNLVASNTGGQITLKLTCSGDPGGNTIVRAAAPVSAGVSRLPRVVMLGMCPAPVLDNADITALYTARFGVLTVGKRVFITVNQIVDGWESAQVTFNAVVPTSS